MTVDTFKINKNALAKKIDVSVGDKMTVAEAERFANEFQRTVAGIDASSFELHVDCTSMKVLTPELSEKLTGAMQLYRQAGFKKVIFLTQNDPILKMQLSRVARTAGLTNAEVLA